MKKILQPFFASLLIGTSVLTLASCQKNKNPIIEKEKDNILKTNLQEYIDNSSSIMKALVLANNHKYDPKTILQHQLNMKSDLKTKLSSFFSEASLKNYDFLSLFRNQDVGKELFKESINFPLAQNRNETGLLSLVRILLAFITQGNLKADNEVFKDILSRNLEESFKFYQESNYIKYISLLQVKLKEHNDFVRQGKTYAEVLEWSGRNIRTILLKMGTGAQEIKNLDSEYQKMNEELIDIYVKNAFSKRNDKENPPVPEFKFNQKILNNLKLQIAKPENIIELGISFLPILHYLLDTIEDMPLKDVTEIWTDGFLSRGTPPEIKNFVEQQLSKKYKFVDSLSIEQIFNKLKTTLKLDDNGFNLRKLLLTFETVPSLKKIFDGIMLKLHIDQSWLLNFDSKTPLLQALAFGGVAVGSVVDIEIFKLAFPAIRAKIEPTINKYINLIETNIDKYENLQKKLLGAEALISRKTSFNIKETFFVAEELADKLNDIMTNQKDVIIKAHKEGQESFFKTLRNLLDSSDNGTKPLSEIINTDRMYKINCRVGQLYRGIEMFGIPQLVEIIKNNDNYYVNSLEEKYSSEKWEITKAQLQETDNNRIIRYLLSYKFENQEYKYSIELQTVSKESNQLLITQFIKEN